MKIMNEALKALEHIAGCAALGQIAASAKDPHNELRIRFLEISEACARVLNDAALHAQGGECITTRKSVDVESLKFDCTKHTADEGQIRTIFRVIDHLAASGYLSSISSREAELMGVIAKAALCILEGKTGISDTVWFSDSETLFDHLRAALPIDHSDWPEEQERQLRDFISGPAGRKLT